MAHVSQKNLKSRIAKEITKRFVAALVTLDTKTAQNFFQSFFTDTEQIMFAKRFAVLFLLHEEWSPYRIAQLLNVSASTVRRLDRELSFDDQVLILKEFKRLERGSGLLEELQDLLVNGFSRDPKKRNKWLNDFEKRYG